MRYTLKGTICADEDAPIYRWFGLPAACPQDIRQALHDNPAGEEFVLEINSGGGSVYAQAVDACDTAYVTRIHTAFPGVDCWFPDLDKDPAWQIVETDGPYVWGEVAYSYLTYRRVAPAA